VLICVPFFRIEVWVAVEIVVGKLTNRDLVLGSRPVFLLFIPIGNTCLYLRYW